MSASHARVPAAECTFRLLLGHELDLHRAHPARLVTTGLLAALLVLALCRGGAGFRERAANVREAAAAARTEWDGRAPDQWLSAGVRDGRWVFQPPPGASVLTEGIARGRSAGLPVRVGLAPAHRLELAEGHLGWNPQVGRFGSLDLGFLLTVLAPLWTILLTFDAVCGEKERGTLRLVFSHPVDRGRYLRAKAAALLVWLAATLALALPVGLLLCAAAGDFADAALEPVRLVGFVATAYLYLAFWGMLGLWASTGGAESRSSLMLLVLLWALFTFVIPRVAMIAAELLHPQATKIEVDIAKRALFVEARRVLDEDHHGTPPASWMEERVLVAEQALPREAEADRVVADSRAAVTQVKTWLASLSPMAVTSLALLDLAGTGEHRARSFRAQVDAYRRELSAYYAAAIRQSPQEAAAIYAQVPTFEYREETAAAALGRAWPRMLWLALLAAAAYGAALRGIARYDLR